MNGTGLLKKLLKKPHAGIPPPGPLIGCGEIAHTREGLGVVGAELCLPGLQEPLAQGNSVLMPAHPGVGTGKAADAVKGVRAGRTHLNG